MLKYVEALLYKNQLNAQTKKNYNGPNTTTVKKDPISTVNIKVTIYMC